MSRTMLAAIAWVVVCGGPATAQPPEWRAIYPLQVKHRWTYVSSDPMAAADPKQKDAGPKKEVDPQKQLVIEVERTENYTRKVTKEDKTTEEKYTAYVLKMSSGDKVKRDHVVVMTEGAYRLSVDGTAITPPALFLKFGLKTEGEKWEWDSISGNTQIKGTCTIGSTVTAGQVRVPYKNRMPLDGIIVTFSNKKTGAERQEVVTWYVANVGMVKQHVKAGNHEIVHELVDFAPAK